MNGDRISIQDKPVTIDFPSLNEREASFVCVIALHPEVQQLKKEKETKITQTALFQVSSYWGTWGICKLSTWKLSKDPNLIKSICALERVWANRRFRLLCPYLAFLQLQGDIVNPKKESWNSLYLLGSAICLLTSPLIYIYIIPMEKIKLYFKVYQKSYQDNEFLMVLQN